jgi:hypothetical protein
VVELSKKENDEFIAEVELVIKAVDPKYSFHYHGFVEIGWKEPVLNFFRKIAELGYDVRVQQIKEKFGDLCLYCYMPEAIEDSEKRVVFESLRKECERACSSICEYCGRKPAKVRFDIGWNKTLCEDHHNAEMAEILMDGSNW